MNPQQPGQSPEQGREQGPERSPERSPEQSPGSSSAPGVTVGYCRACGKALDAASVRAAPSMRRLPWERLGERPGARPERARPVLVRREAGSPQPVRGLPIRHMPRPIRAPRRRPCRIATCRPGWRSCWG